jgi:hypothetical protein
MQNISKTIRQSIPNVEKIVVQQVLINQSGLILESDNNLVPLQRWHQKSLADVYPFLESIFPSLLALNYDIEVYYPTVEILLDHISIGFFQYTFTKIKYQEETVIVWTIIQDKEVANKIKAQQTANELVIKSETEIK